jgi:hypothetical protein
VEKISVRFCPRCDKQILKKNEGIYVIPPLTHGTDAWLLLATPDRPAANEGVPVEIHVCKKCRHIEIVALARKGAEA